MKLDTLRPGMVVEKMKTVNAKQKSATPIKEDLYEVIKIDNNQTGGYTMTAIWLGNIVANEACMVDISTLNNPAEWKLHDKAFVQEKHQIVKEISFVDRDPLFVTTNKTIPIVKTPSEQLQEELEPIKEPKPVAIKEPKPVIDYKKLHDEIVVSEEAAGFLDYGAYASYTKDDLDYLLKTFLPSYNFYQKKKPRPNTKSAFVHQQELSAFRDGYSIREIRNLGLRIKWTPKTTSTKCSYQTVIKRLIQATVWYAKPADKQILKQIKTTL
tara:strand:- start:927 stop:1733 length:807 start_codon:yes stop_codon:yes gene_type:complete